MLTPIELLAGLWLAAWPSLHAGPVVAVQAPQGVVPPAAAAAEARAALLDLSDEELAGQIEADPSSVGSLSIGTPGGGLLVNAVALPETPYWEIASNAASWGTSETMASIETAVRTVHDLLPDTPPIIIGDISDADGGRLKRHESHQVGRDVDFGFYFTTGKATWFAPGTTANFDLERNWALVRALVARTDVETILLDMRIQRRLYQHALGIGEDKDWLDRVFQCARGSAGAVVKHVAGHRTHYHVRFYNPVAQELGRRAHPVLVQLKVLAPPVFTVRHVIRKGETLGHLAARYGTSVRALMQANGLRSTRLRAGRAYRIPVRAAVPPSQPVVVRQRVLPAYTPPAMVGVDWPTAEALYGGTVAER